MTDERDGKNKVPVEFFKEKDLLGQDKIHHPEQTAVAAAPSDDLNAPVSNYQSVLNFCLLCILSFGIYYFFWFYKHWVYLKEEKQEDVNPGMRTLFTVFFGGALFNKFFKLSAEKGFKPLMPAVPLFLLFIASIFTAYTNSILGIFAFFSFLFLVPVVRAMNYYYLYAHPAYRVQTGMAKDEKVFLVLVWILLAYFVFFAS